MIFLIKRPIKWTLANNTISILSQQRCTFECRSPKRWAKFVQLRKTFTSKTAHILIPSDLIHDQDNNKNRLATSESRLRVHIINLIIRVLIWGDIKAEFKCIYISSIIHFRRNLFLKDNGEDSFYRGVSLNYICLYLKQNKDHRKITARIIFFYRGSALNICLYLKQNKDHKLSSLKSLEV